MWRTVSAKNQNVSSEEHMVKYKGRYKFWQCIQDKPVMWGIK